MSEKPAVAVWTRNEGWMWEQEASQEWPGALSFAVPVIVTPSGVNLRVQWTLEMNGLFFSTRSQPGSRKEEGL